MQTSPGRSEPTDRLDRPRFRQDLVAELIDDQGARFIDVMDPDSGSLFRFYEVEYSLACGMDGERDVPGIVKWAQDELGLSPSQQEVRSVIATLGDLGFIDTGAADAGTDQPELAASIVVVAPAKPPTAPELELGSAGTPAPKREPARPVAAEVELGAPGAAARRASAAVDDVALGAPGSSAPARPARPQAPSASRTEDVSLDLSDHVAVRPDDVKEAVRASRVMSAVEPRELPLDKPSAKTPSIARPPERAAAFDRPPEVAKAPEQPFPRTPEPRTPEPRAPEPRAPEPRTSASRSAEVPAVSGVDDTVRATPSARPARPPVELPKQPIPAEPKTGAQAAAQTGGGGLLTVLLVIMILAGAGFLVWKYVLAKPAPAIEPAPSAPVTEVKPALPPPPPPAPPAPTSKIAMEASPPDEIKTTRAGVIETILADKAIVKDHDVVAKLVGDKPIEAERASILRDQKRVQDQIDAASKRVAAARASGNKAAETAASNDLATRQAQLATKQGLLATKTADLEKFLMYAPSAGTFAPAVKLGQKVALAAVVARLQREATPVATFKLADPKAIGVNTSVELSVGNAEQHMACAVTEVQADGVKVACPPDPALVEGAEVTLKLPAPSDQPPATAPAPSAAPVDPAAAPASPAAGSSSN